MYPMGYDIDHTAPDTCETGRNLLLSINPPGSFFSVSSKMSSCA